MGIEDEVSPETLRLIEQLESKKSYSQMAKKSTTKRGGRRRTKRRVTKKHRR